MPEMQLLLEDYVAQLRVGIHAHERTAPQRVSVSVRAVLRYAPRFDEISETYNYENIIQTIAQLSETHFDLLESFAQKLGDQLLEDPGLAQVEVKLLKLDIIADGKIGVQYSAP